MKKKITVKYLCQHAIPHSKLTCVFKQKICLYEPLSEGNNVYLNCIGHGCIQMALPGGSTTQTPVYIQRTFNNVTKQLTGSPCGLVVARRCPSKVGQREVNPLSRSSFYNPGRLGRAAVCLISHRAGEGTRPCKQFL